MQIQKLTEALVVAGLKITHINIFKGRTNIYRCLSGCDWIFCLSSPKYDTHPTPFE